MDLGADEGLDRFNYSGMAAVQGRDEGLLTVPLGGRIKYGRRSTGNVPYGYYGI